jgi:DNA polymerase (family 10)
MTRTNQEIAKKLREQASELARAGHNLYRVRAFRTAAMAVMGLTYEVAELVATGGAEELQRVPGIGPSLAETIASYARDHSQGDNLAA